jgi:hypothetical protein
LAQVRIQLGEFQKAALSGGRRHRPIDIEPFEDVWDSAHGLDAAGRSPASAHGQETEPAFILTEAPHRAVVLRRADAL